MNEENFKKLLSDNPSSWKEKAEKKIAGIQNNDVISPERMFSLDEMKACALAMANWGEGFKDSLTPAEYFKETFGIDISNDKGYGRVVEGL